MSGRMDYTVLKIGGLCPSVDGALEGGDHMAIEQTNLANSIDASADKAKLDEVAKKLVKHKIILAEILKECVDEFRDYEISFIEQKCIVGDVRMDEVSVDQDMEDADSSIVGADTEDNSHNEGLVRYDLVFEARVPKSGEIIGLIINVEIQVNLNPGYPLITRAIYYLARLISRQKGTVFQKSDYGKIRKVYSIWICPDPSKENRNSIVEYGFTQQKVIGKVDEPVKNYDKMKAIIINLNDDGMDNRTDIIRLLSTLLSTTETVERRKKILENDFHIPMTKEIEEGMQDMCNYGTAVQTYGERIGVQAGQLKLILSTMKKHGWDVEKTMDFMDVDAKDRATLAASAKAEMERQSFRRTE